MAKPNNDLTGRWAGNYWQHGRAHPIRAELAQDGGRLTGMMHDGETDSEQSVFDLAVEAGLPPGADEQIEAKLRELCPETPKRPIRFVTHLPEGSALVGSIEGESIEFLKTYEGVHFGGYRLGDTLVGHTVENHSVHYRGRLSQDGKQIEGRWWIESEPGNASRMNEGSFLLTAEDGR